MNKKVIIGLVTFSVIGLTTLGIYLYLRKKKNNKEVISIDEVSVNDVPETIKEKVENSTPSTPLTINYNKEPSIIKLKDDLSRAYYVMEILDNKNGVVINKSTSKPVADGVDTGTWMQLVRNSDRFKNLFLNKAPNTNVKNYGLKLIDKLNKEINRIFSSSKYTTNNKWYKDYLSDGGTPVPSNIA